MFYRRILYKNYSNKDNLRKITTFNNPGGGNNNDIFIISLIVGFFLMFKNK